VIVGVYDELLGIGTIPRLNMATVEKGKKENFMILW
jgi:hypothetical protein